MSKTKIITSAISMGKVQHCISPATTIETGEGPVIVRPRHIDSSLITIQLTMIVGGKFDESKKGALLKAIMDKLSEVEL